MILTAIWVYQAVLKIKKPHGLFWVAGCAALFFAVQWIFVQLNIVIIDTYQGDDIGAEYDRSLGSVGDRATNEKGTGGIFLNILYELLPPLAGFLSVALVRAKFILNESLTVATLFGGIKEMFVSIKDSFKTSE
ncbi:hypothetical protein Q9L42_006655 [Methylomarinum sp. Ch1-1]|uniref:Uncharacterized protein n=1 Tax=Methylomarinum roseum TaxID=3067653 RepID=A0AAU7NXW7_9GAMM|nr:hypothetical protein [Methylomarinum sp. Ch1-1]MDP4522101.1 hypothetical protein [Methylomarinum sp. Ch1-1]